MPCLRRHGHNRLLVGQQRARAVIGQRDGRAAAGRRQLKSVRRSVHDKIRRVCRYPGRRGNRSKGNNLPVAEPVRRAAHRVRAGGEGDRRVGPVEVNVRPVVLMLRLPSAGHIDRRCPVAPIDRIGRRRRQGDKIAPRREDRVQPDELLIRVGNARQRQPRRITNPLPRAALEPSRRGHAHDRSRRVHVPLVYGVLLDVADRHQTNSVPNSEKESVAAPA